MLFFLDSIADPYTARDGNGSGLAGALLYFYRQGTSTEAAVYDGYDLGSEIPQPVTADDDGIFETIYLDPTVAYRSILKTADGRLVYDVDYDFETAAPGLNVYRAPKIQALDAGEPQPAATITAYLTGTTTKTDIYADAALETPLPNPVEADAAGFFPPIYVDAAISYKLVFSWGPATIDPYPTPVVTITVGEDGFMTSQGFSDGSYGAIDPDPYEYEGEQVIALISQTGFFFVLFDIALPPDLTGGLYVEKNTAGTYELLTVDDAELIEGGYRWSGTSVNWSSGIVGQDRTVTFL